MISVVMPSYLGDYPNCASNREEKLPRAIESFLSQNIGELIVVADGCEKTAEIARKYPIRVIYINKRPHFSGDPRNIGIQESKYDYICYLDNDDVFGEGHLQSMKDNMEMDWLYWADKIEGISERELRLEHGYIGTGCIAHRKSLNVKWNGGYDQDWNVVEQLMKYEGKRINANYHIMHVPNGIDK